MPSRPKNYKYARNKNILVIGGSGKSTVNFSSGPTDCKRSGQGGKRASDRNSPATKTSMANKTAAIGV